MILGLGLGLQYRRGLIGAPIDERFIMSVNATDGIFTIPTTGGGYLYDIETSDGYIAIGITGNHTINFPSGVGIYNVFISGNFPRIFFNNTGDKLKLLDIKNWGNIIWNDFNSAFFGCNNLTGTFKDIPNLTNVTSLRLAFTSTKINNPTMSDWDVSNVTNMTATFNDTLFDQDISGWDINQVTIFTNFLINSTLSTVNYGLLINGWAAQLPLNPLARSISFGNSKYDSTDATVVANRDLLISHFTTAYIDGGAV